MIIDPFAQKADAGLHLRLLHVVLRIIYTRMCLSYDTIIRGWNRKALPVALQADSKTFLQPVPVSGNELVVQSVKKNEK